MSRSSATTPSSLPVTPATPTASDGNACPLGATVAALAQHLPRVRQRRKAARPQELLEAALDLFVAHGLAATRAEDVARAAGVSKGTLYLYYPSKDELFKAVVRANLTQVIAVGGEMADQFEGPTSDLLHALARTWWAQVGESKAAGLIRLIISEAPKFPDLAQFYMNEVVAPTHALLARVIERGIQRGEFRAMDVNSVVHGLIAPVQFLVLYRLCASACAVNPVPLEPESFMTTQIELLLRGLETPKPLAANTAPRKETSGGMHVAHPESGGSS